MDRQHYHYKNYTIIYYPYSTRDLFEGGEWLAVSGKHGHNFSHSIFSLNWAAVNAISAHKIKMAESGLVAFLKLHEAPSER